MKLKFWTARAILGNKLSADCSQGTPQRGHRPLNGEREYTRDHGGGGYIWGSMEKSIETKASPEKVWEMLALDRFPEWMDMMESVK